MSGFFDPVIPSGRTTARTTTERLAESYRPNAQMDRLLAAIERDPSLGEKLSPVMRMQIGFYVSAKDAAAEIAAANGGS